MKGTETDNNVPCKTPEEVKKSLERCSQNSECIKCSYYKAHDTKYSCLDRLLKDTLALIEQLERERDAAIEALHDVRASVAGLVCMVDRKNEKIPKWTSVEERLPEAGVFVLLQYAKNAQNPTLHARNTMAVGRYEYGMFLVEGCSVRVTHWMPLPEPPKEE